MADACVNVGRLTEQNLHLLHLLSFMKAVSWSHGVAAGVSWRTKHLCGSGPSRTRSSPAGFTRKEEACPPCLDVIGRCAGLCCVTQSSCTLRMTARRSWKEPLISAQPSKELIEEIYKPEGVDDILGHLGCFCREIVDNHEKENALNIVTEERTYHIYTESPEDARYMRPTHHVCSVSASVWKQSVGTMFPLVDDRGIFFIPHLTDFSLCLPQLLVQCAESGPHCRPGAAHGDAPWTGQSQECCG